MNGVKFGDKHSITDWDLLMTSKSIGEPEPKILTVEIPGSDGTKDLTEAFGEVNYNNRTLTFNFDLFQSPSDWWTLKEKISKYLHGKKLKIILDQDPNYFYLGRCKITNFSNDYTVAHLTIECDCEPYKYKLSETSNTKTITAGTTYTYSNLYKSVIPTLVLSAAMTLEFKDNTYILGAGTHKVLDIKFVEGNNSIKVTAGSGTLTVKYQEATL